MIRIAFLGADSTHTEAFASRIHGRKSTWQGRAQVVSIFDEDSVQARVKAEALGIARVAASPEDALEGADLAMVISRFADSHFLPTKLALEAGIPTFVDKPFTQSRSEAEELAAISRKTGTPLCSSSPLRFANELNELKGMLAGSEEEFLSAVVTVPANCTDLGEDCRLDSAFFYGIHGLEMLFELVGCKTAAVDVHYGVTVITAHLELASGRTAVFQLIRDTVEFYRVELYMRGGISSRDINLNGGYYDHELRFLLGIFFSGKGTISLESSIAAVALLEQIDKCDPLRGHKRL